jgi:acetyl-CoA C-acetyltransferase
VDRQCGSSQQALHFAAQAVASGTAELVVAGGVQNMSAVPIGAAMLAGEQFGFATPFEGSAGWAKRYGDQEISQFRAAELIAQRWGVSREDMEAFALESHCRALAAIDGGAFAREIVSIGDVAIDEGPRRDTSAAKMAGLPPLTEGGRVTAAVASQISDGASAVLVASERAMRTHGLTPRARVHHLSARGSDPVLMLTAPIPATRHALDRAGMRIEDIDLFEVNEAFASVVLSWSSVHRPDPDRVNVNGGAIALGHPLGCTGAKLTTTLLYEMKRRSARYGMVTMCVGGGMGAAGIFERV